MKLITLTHANTNVPVQVAANLIFYFYPSPAHHATHIVAPGGAFFPVKETPEVLAAMLNPAEQNAQPQHKEEV